jgi:hypothetical protein
LTDPGNTAFTVKGGPNYSGYIKDSSAFAGLGDFSNTWSSPNGAGVSHIVFYDTDAVIPLPAAAWLLLAGLGGMGLVARRRKAAA